MDELTQRGYDERIDTMADVIEERLEDDPVREASDMVFEEIDSSQLVIYNRYHLPALHYSENGPQEWHHMVDDSSSTHEVLQAMLYSAMEADLYDELRNRGVY